MIDLAEKLCQGQTLNARDEDKEFLSLDIFLLTSLLHDIDIMILEAIVIIHGQTLADRTNPGSSFQL